MNFFKIIDHIAGPEDRFSLEDRILNTILLCSAIARYVSLSAEVAMNFTGSLFWYVLGTNILVTILYIIGRSKPSHKKLVFPFVILQFIIIGITWYFYDGISGTSNAQILAFMIVLPILVKGKMRWAVLFLFILSATGVLILELHNPSIVFNYSTEELEILDTYFTTLSITISIIAMISLIVNSYSKKQKQIEELNNTKNKFFSIIAHDLKGPLAGLTQLGEYLTNSELDIDKESRKEMEETIYNSAKNTYNLLENLLQWARSESGQLKANPARINLLKIAKDIESILKEKIINKKINLEIDIHKDMHVYADENMIHLVIRNLLSNATKFTPTNGKICITARKELNSDLVNISIKDNGIGIEEEAIEKLFDLDSTYIKKGTEREGGTGLGLKLCKEFVLKNNGKISVQSKINQGSNFIVLLPTG